MFNPKPLEKTLFNSSSSGAGDSYLILNYVYKSLVVTFTGLGDTTFVIQVSNDGTNWINLLSLTTDDYLDTDVAFKYIRGNITVAGGKTVLAKLVANK